MLPADVDPVLLEARALADELRLTRRALRHTALRDDVRALHLAAERTIEARLSALLDDPEHRGVIERALDHRAGVLRIAAIARRDRARRDALLRDGDTILAGAIDASRPTTAAERDRIAELREAAEAPAEWHRRITTPEARDGVLEALGRLRLREARAQLRSGLLLTEQMLGIIAEALPSLLRGAPVLLVGETGGAKTALAEHLSRAIGGKDPEFVSGYGDITGSQLIGAHELWAEGGGTVSAFVPGPMLRAMAEGRPLILDELNAMPAEFLKRLNRVLQLRPGDDFAVQENAGRPIRIAEGFAILATANEQTPHRYRGLDRLSAELVNRFGANTYRVRYPDAGLGYADFPQENALLAAAAVVDRHGQLPQSLDGDLIERAARAAFISQQVFSGTHGEGFDEYLTTEHEIDGRPGLEESVLAPRTLVAILEKVAGSAGSIGLDAALTRFVEGVMHREDRRVLALILRGQGFRVGAQSAPQPSTR